MRLHMRKHTGKYLICTTKVSKLPNNKKIINGFWLKRKMLTVY